MAFRRLNTSSAGMGSKFDFRTSADYLRWMKKGHVLSSSLPFSSYDRAHGFWWVFLATITALAKSYALHHIFHAHFSLPLNDRLKDSTLTKALKCGISELGCQCRRERKGKFDHIPA